jgi:AcrR family transcriptional regulator
MSKSYHHGALREALLAAAETLLDRNGIDALTLRAAAREAGVSHGAPAHHFGDLSGLLTALAAEGFVRLRRAMEAEAEAEPTGADPSATVRAFGRGYVRFAQTHPGIFLLMFRSERLDWSTPSLSTAGSEAFAYLSKMTPEDPGTGCGSDFETLILSCTRWALVHGLAILVIDGRLGAMADPTSGADLDRLIEAVLARGLVD